MHQSFIFNWKSQIGFGFEKASKTTLKGVQIANRLPMIAVS